MLSDPSSRWPPRPSTASPPSTPTSWVAIALALLLVLLLAVVSFGGGREHS